MGFEKERTRVFELSLNNSATISVFECVARRKHVLYFCHKNRLVCRLKNGSIKKSRNE